MCARSERKRLLGGCECRRQGGKDGQGARGSSGATLREYPRNIWSGSSPTSQSRRCNEGFLLHSTCHNARRELLVCHFSSQIGSAPEVLLSSYSWRPDALSR